MAAPMEMDADNRAIIENAARAGAEAGVAAATAKLAGAGGSGSVQGTDSTSTAEIFEIYDHAYSSTRAALKKSNRMQSNGTIINARRIEEAQWAKLFCDFSTYEPQTLGYSYSSALFAAPENDWATIDRRFFIDVCTAFNIAEEPTAKGLVHWMTSMGGEGVELSHIDGMLATLETWRWASYLLGDRTWVADLAWPIARFDPRRLRFYADAVDNFARLHNVPPPAVEASIKVVPMVDVTPDKTWSKIDALLNGRFDDLVRGTAAERAAKQAPLVEITDRIYLPGARGTTVAGPPVNPADESVNQATALRRMLQFLHGNLVFDSPYNSQSAAQFIVRLAPRLVHYLPAAFYVGMGSANNSHQNIGSLMVALLRPAPDAAPAPDEAGDMEVGARHRDARPRNMTALLEAMTYALVGGYVADAAVVRDVPLLAIPTRANALQTKVDLPPLVDLVPPERPPLADVVPPIAARRPLAPAEKNMVAAHIDEFVELVQTAATLYQCEIPASTNELRREAAAILLALISASRASLRHSKWVLRDVLSGHSPWRNVLPLHEGWMAATARVFGIYTSPATILRQIAETFGPEVDAALALIVAGVPPGRRDAINLLLPEDALGDWRHNPQNLPRMMMDRLRTLDLLWQMSDAQRVVRERPTWLLALVKKLWSWTWGNVKSFARFTVDAPALVIGAVWAFKGFVSLTAAAFVHSFSKTATALYNLIVNRGMPHTMRAFSAIAEFIHAFWSAIPGTWMLDWAAGRAVDLVRPLGEFVRWAAGWLFYIICGEWNGPASAVVAENTAHGVNNLANATVALNSTVPLTALNSTLAAGAPINATLVEQVPIPADAPSGLLSLIQSVIDSTMEMAWSLAGGTTKRAASAGAEFAQSLAKDGTNAAAENLVNAGKELAAEPSSHSKIAELIYSVAEYIASTISSYASTEAGAATGAIAAAAAGSVAAFVSADFLYGWYMRSFVDDGIELMGDVFLGVHANAVASRGWRLASLSASLSQTSRNMPLTSSALLITEAQIYAGALQNNAMETVRGLVLQISERAARAAISSSMRTDMALEVEFDATPFLQFTAWWQMRAFFTALIRRTPVGARTHDAVLAALSLPNRSNQDVDDLLAALSQQGLPEDDIVQILGRNNMAFVYDSMQILGPALYMTPVRALLLIVPFMRASVQAFIGSSSSKKILGSTRSLVHFTGLILETNKPAADVKPADRDLILSMLGEQDAESGTAGPTAQPTLGRRQRGLGGGARRPARN